MAKKYRKKPIVIEAIQYHGNNPSMLMEFGAEVKWDHALGGIAIWNDPEDQWINIPISHWVIKGVNGEFYPCDPEIFEKTYDEVEDEVSDHIKAAKEYELREAAK